jgi:hypothetical protein
MTARRFSLQIETQPLTLRRFNLFSISAQQIFYYTALHRHP